MAHGLALLGCCPRCSGELRFAREAHVDHHDDDLGRLKSREPHRVLGLPRPARLRTPVLRRTSGVEPGDNAFSHAVNGPNYQL